MKWALTAVALMSVLATTRAAATGPGLRVFGLTADQRLVSFRSETPSQLREIGVVSPLQTPDKSLVGIDFRVQDGQLYGVGNAGGIYTIDTRTAAPTLVSQLSVALDVNAKFFGVDFNPSADRLRIISDTGQNLSHNVNPGGVTAPGANLTYTQPPIVPAPYTPVTTMGVTGVAYTNNDLEPDPATAKTGTTLFDIDAKLDQVIIQSPPNNGILVATGKLGVDADVAVGFDIYTSLKKGVAISNAGFASLVVGGFTGFYRVSLLTGKATLIGNFSEPVVDVAVRLNQ